jgi:hypothetical protein
VTSRTLASGAAVDALTAAFERPLDYAASLGAGGLDVIGASSPAVPRELLRAAGLESVVLRWPVGPTPLADARLESGVFSQFVRALIDCAFTAELSWLRALVLPRSSEQHYKAYLYLRELARQPAEGLRCPPVLLYDLLQSVSPEVLAYVLNRTAALAASVEALTGRSLSAAQLAENITEANAAKAAARRLLNLRRGAPRISGTEALPLLGARHVMTPGEYTVLANIVADELGARAALAGPRIVIAADCPDHPQLHAAVESRGAVVVGEDSPWGSRGVEPDVSTDRDALTAIAESYYKHGDGTRRPRQADDEWFDRAVCEADGVLFWLSSSDGVRGWDYPRLRQRLGTRGIPHLLWRGEPQSETAASRSDLIAFLDSAAACAARRDGR